MWKQRHLLLLSFVFLQVALTAVHAQDAAGAPSKLRLGGGVHRSHTSLGSGIRFMECPGP